MRVSCCESLFFEYSLPKMSSSESNSDVSFTSDDDSEYNYIPGIYHRDLETEKAETSDSEVESEDNYGDRAYTDEPLADKEWLEEYEMKQAEKQKRLEGLKDRLSGKESISNWCSCGRCSIELLQNSNECYCCQDIGQCCDALTDELVLREVSVPPTCITLHPAFEPVCLNPWSLRLSAGKYRTIDKKAYRQTESEEKFLRSIAYREFTQLVHQRIGKTRIPLPACAYHLIRNTFKSAESNEFTGFEEEVED